MANQKQNPLVLFLLIVVIVIAIFFIVRAALPKRSRPVMADWTCEGHGYQFVAPVEAGPIKCPKHGDEAVRTIYYECSVHGHRFEAYRMKPAVPVTERREGAPPEMYETLCKVPGGEWTKSMAPPRIICPHGNDDPKTLKYSPPK